MTMTLYTLFKSTAFKKHQERQVCLMLGGIFFHLYPSCDTSKFDSVFICVSTGRPTNISVLLIKAAIVIEIKTTIFNPDLTFFYHNIL